MHSSFSHPPPSFQPLPPLPLSLCPSLPLPPLKLSPLPGPRRQSRVRRVRVGAPRLLPAARGAGGVGTLRARRVRAGPGCGGGHYAGSSGLQEAESRGVGCATTCCCGETAPGAQRRGALEVSPASHRATHPTAHPPPGLRLETASP